VARKRGLEGLPPSDPENPDEVPAGPERVAPGTGTPKPAIAVTLTEEEVQILAEEFSTEIELQHAAQEPNRQDWEKWLRLYRAQPNFQVKTYPLQSSSNVVVALSAIYTDQVVARIMQSIFQPEPLWVVSELNRRTAAAAKPYERWLDWNRKNTWDEYRCIKPFVQDVVKLGTGIVYNDWRSETIYRYDDKTRTTVESGFRRGPRPAWVPREDFLLPIGFNDIQQAPWCAHRIWCSWDMMERWAHQNIIDRTQFAKLKGHSDDESQLRLERRANHERMADGSSDDRFGIWSPWYVWFNRDLDRDGWPECYVMLLHTGEKAVLRLQSNPSPSATRPYVSARFIEVEGEFDGIGIPEQVESLQEEATTIHNQRRDRSHLANIVMYKGSATGNLPNTIRPESGKVIKVLDPKDLQEFHPSSNVSEQVFEEESVTRLAELRVGLNDPGLGKATSPVGRAAATTMMALMQEGTRRFDLNVSDIRTALNEQGHQITEAWQVYGLPEPDESGSPEQVLDEDDAAIVRELLSMPVNLRGLIAIQINISTAAINKEVEKQSNIQLYQIVQGYMQQVLQLSMAVANPQIPPPIKDLIVHGVEGLDKLLKRIFQAHNAFDLETVLVGDIFGEMAMQVQQQPMLPGPQGQMPGQQQAAAAAGQQGVSPLIEALHKGQMQ
jgi:hypothetical protein